jgi:hypothetical protein
MQCESSAMSLLGKSKEKKDSSLFRSFLENPARYLLQSVRELTFFRIFLDMPLMDTAAIDDDAVSMLTELTTTGPGVHLVHPFLGALSSFLNPLFCERFGDMRSGVLKLYV